VDRLDHTHLNTVAEGHQLPLEGHLAKCYTLVGLKYQAQAKVLESK